MVAGGRFEPSLRRREPEQFRSRGDPKRNSKRCRSYEPRGIGVAREQTSLRQTGFPNPLLRWERLCGVLKLFVGGGCERWNYRRCVNGVLPLLKRRERNREKDLVARSAAIEVWVEQVIGDSPSVPESYGPLRRDNNLLCFAAMMFVIGFIIIQIAMGFGSLGLYLSIDPTALLIAIFVGIMLILIGILLMWKWYNSSM